MSFHVFACQIAIRPYLSPVKVSFLLLTLVCVACNQYTPPTAETFVNDNADKLFFVNAPELTEIAVDENQLFASLFAQLSELPKTPYKNLAVQLQTIGQEADKIKAADFPNTLQIPQLLGRYKVFQTRIGIVRFADVSQHTAPKFAAAMNDVVWAWNTFANHYNRLVTQSNL